MDSAVAYKFGITKPLQIAPMQDELAKRPVSILLSVEDDVDVYTWAAASPAVNIAAPEMTFFRIIDFAAADAAGFKLALVIGVQKKNKKAMHRMMRWFIIFTYIILKTEEWFGGNVAFVVLKYINMAMNTNMCGVLAVKWVDSTALAIDRSIGVKSV